LFLSFVYGIAVKTPIRTFIFKSVQWKSMGSKTTLLDPIDSRFFQNIFFCVAQGKKKSDRFDDM